MRRWLVLGAHRLAETADFLEALLHNCLEQREFSLVVVQLVRVHTLLSKEAHNSLLLRENVRTRGLTTSGGQLQNLLLLRRRSLADAAGPAALARRGGVVPRHLELSQCLWGAFLNLVHIWRVKFELGVALALCVYAVVRHTSTSSDS